MTWVSYLLGFLISSVSGTLWHLIRGGSLGKLFWLLLWGWAGFWIGHSIANQLDYDFLALGPLNLGTAVPLSFIMVFIGHRLTYLEFNPQDDVQENYDD